VPLSIEDRFELHELCARYAHAFDSGDAETWSALFAPDGRFVLPDGTPISGRGPLREFVLTRTAETPGMRHLISNILVEESGSGARGVAYFYALRFGDDGQLRLRNIGRYMDEYVRDDGRWLFGSRQVVQELSPGLVDAPFAFGS
jgi:hypothetical protein